MSSKTDIIEISSDEEDIIITGIKQSSSRSFPLLSTLLHHIDIVTAYGPFKAREQQGDDNPHDTHPRPIQLECKSCHAKTELNVLECGHVVCAKCAATPLVTCPEPHCLHTSQPTRLFI